MRPTRGQTCTFGTCLDWPSGGGSVLGFLKRLSRISRTETQAPVPIRDSTSNPESVPRQSGNPTATAPVPKALTDERAEAAYFDCMDQLQDAVSRRDFVRPARLARANLEHIPCLYGLALDPTVPLMSGASRR